MKSQRMEPTESDWHCLPEEVHALVLYCASTPTQQPVNMRFDHARSWPLLCSYRGVSRDTYRVITTLVVPRLITCIGLRGVDLPVHHFASLRKLRATANKETLPALGAMPALTKLELLGIGNLPPMAELATRLIGLSVQGELSRHDYTFYSALVAFSMIGLHNAVSLRSHDTVRKLRLTHVRSDLAIHGATLTHLDIRGAQARSVALPALANLRTLVTSSSFDTSQLLALTSLTRLEMSDCFFTDAAHLTALCGLERLSLSDCHCVPEGLTALTNVTDLTLAWCIDTAPFDARVFTNLTRLCTTATAMTPLSALTRLTKLAVYEFVTPWPTLPLDSDLLQLPNLTKLDLGRGVGAGVECTTLGALTQLVSFRTTDDRLNICDIAALTRLRRLFLPNAVLAVDVCRPFINLVQLHCRAIYDGCRAELQRLLPCCHIVTTY